MQEFTVQLFDDGSAQIGGTGANLELRFGYSKNAHMYSVKFIRSKEWEDLYIRVHFHPEADIYDVDPVLAQNNIVNIPAMITSMPGKGKLTIEGTDGYKTITSADIPYRVSENSGIDSETDPEPGESSFQQFVDAVKEDAKTAEQAAKDAESALAETKEAASLALSNIETARTNAISDIEKIESEVKGEIQEDVDSAKSSAEAASKSAEEAKSAADSAKKSLYDLETAKQSALSEISKEKDTSVGAIGSAKESALTELSKSANSSIQNVKRAETDAIEAVKDEASSQKTALSNASNAALTSIDSAKQGAVKAVEDKASEESSAIDEKAAQVIQSVQNAGDAEISAIGQATTSGIEQITQSAGQHLTQIDSAADDAVQDIMDVKEDSLDEFEAVNAHPPIQNPETGKWQVYSAETSSYVDTKYDWEGGYYSPSVDSEGNLTWQASKEGMDDIPSSNIRGPQGLGVPTPTTNDYGKTPTVKTDGSAYELAGPYAPLSAAIRPTASGNPVSIADSVEWSLQGLKVYGKSTQDGTPSPENPVPIVSAGDGGSIVLTVSDGADQSQSLTLSTPNGLPGIPVDSGGNYTDSIGQQLICDVMDFKSGLFYSNVVYFDLSSHADAMWYTWGVSNGAEGLTGFFMYISDETKTDIDYKIISNILPFSGNPFGGAAVGIGIGNANTATPYLICTVQNTDLSDVSSNDAAVQSFKDFLKGKRCYALSARHAAVTSPIPPEELAAYRALHTYDGTTVINTPEDVAGLEVRYVANAQKYIDDRLAAAESHIQEIAAAQLNAQTGG